MTIAKMTRIVRPVAMFLLPLLLFLLMKEHSVAQERPGEKGRLENARWYVAGDQVIITYDLIGDETLTYNVNIVLTRESDRNFRIAPRSLSGAVGTGKYAGVGREIRWDYRKDVAQILEGSDYAFEFVINIVKEEGGSNLLYYLAGAGVVGGIVGLVLGGGKKTEAAVTGPGILPSPPAERPPSQ